MYIDILSKITNHILTENIFFICNLQHTQKIPTKLCHSNKIHQQTIK
jgi:hypothetical protein